MGSQTRIVISFITLCRPLVDLRWELEELSALAAALQGSAPGHVAIPPLPDEHSLDGVFHRRWRRVARGLLEQWQVMNYVSAVFIGTIATMLQDPMVTSSTISRTSAAVALLYALSSLCCGSMLYLHIVKIKRPQHALDWVINFQTLTSSRWINPLTILATPATFLLWAATFFVLALFISYVWQPPNMVPQLFPRIATACALAMCAGQMLLVAWTLRKLEPAPQPRSRAQTSRTDTLEV
ncbi:uncharacterized protein PHACADRAFT_196508 [Phanerochaete carnosa HHB-10118-sp]|uniref:Uncharacterized protein n=1 Tax=Phanerochaete carnosa (strain HHB-10118-sp) TaxID=650164 RepID=K5VRE9_PHACS|nr:uncharacterized protein PHACADRAFT_196508 [Phanerochaete carnosa HHB-10118-sp]EKM54073.1 hypothetical protein PHACADRAFT_196508 [Phanerochaete carnosa HHB-10118-sp]